MMTEALQQIWLRSADFNNRRASKLSWAITNGPDPAFMVTVSLSVFALSLSIDLYTRFVSQAQQNVHTLQATESIRVVNAIGAGDSVAAGTINYWTDNLTDESLIVIEQDIVKLVTKGNSDEDRLTAAFAFGLSCGAASCMQDVNSFFEYEDTKRIFSSMEVKAG